MPTSAADGVTEPGSGTHLDHKITSLVQAASKALSVTSGHPQQGHSGAAMSQQSHSHFHNDNLVSEAGVPIVKTEPSSANSVTHVAAGRVSHRPGVAGVAPALPSTSGQGTPKSATLPSSSAGKTQVSCGGGGGVQRSTVAWLRAILMHVCITLFGRMGLLLRSCWAGHSKVLSGRLGGDSAGGVPASSSR